MRLRLKFHDDVNISRINVKFWDLHGNLEVKVESRHSENLEKTPNCCDQSKKNITRILSKFGDKSQNFKIKVNINSSLLDQRTCFLLLLVNKS